MIRLKLTKNDDASIRCEALEGVDHFGFGTFLQNLQPSEIESDNFSKQVLINAVEKFGLNGLEIWADNRLAWEDSSYTIIMPISEINKMRGAEKWLRKIQTSD